MAKNQFSLIIDFSESTISSMTNIATSVTFQNVQASLANHNAVPAFYDTTNKKLYSLLTGDDYWAVDDNKLM